MWLWQWCVSLLIVFLAAIAMIFVFCHVISYDVMSCRYIVLTYRFYYHPYNGRWHDVISATQHHSAKVETIKLEAVLDGTVDEVNLSEGSGCFHKFHCEHVGFNLRILLFLV